MKKDSFSSQLPAINQWASICFVCFPEENTTENECNNGKQVGTQTANSYRVDCLILVLLHHCYKYNLKLVSN